MPFNAFYITFFFFHLEDKFVHCRMREAISMFYYMCSESNLRREVFHYVYLAS